MKNAGKGDSESIARYVAAMAQCETEYEHPGAPAPKPSVSTVLKLDELDMADTIAGTWAIHSANAGLFANSTWALDSRNYASVAEAHFQYLAAWGASRLEQDYRGRVNALKPAAAAVRIVSNRNLSPLTRAIRGIDLLIFPTGFVNMVDAFMRGYIQASSSGKEQGVLVATGSVDSGLASDLIGGDAIWRLLKSDFEAAREWLSYIVNPMLLNEVMPADLQVVDDETMKNILAGARGFLQGKLYPGDAADESGVFQLTPQVASANYQVMVFTLFHELCHVALDGMLDLAGTEKESAIDLAALQLYYSYFAEPRERRNPEIVFPARKAQLIFGPAGFYMITICRQYVRMLFRHICAEDKRAVHSPDPVAGIKNSIVQLMVRRNDLGLAVARLAEEDGVLAGDLLNALAESLVMEMAIKQLFKPADKVQITPMGAL